MSAAETEALLYPDDNGEPMSDNTLQFRWIVTLQGGLDAMFSADPNVFVAGDLLWYPVEGQPKVRAAPDAMVAIGRPKGYRGSYKQWIEGNVPPQVVFEVLSPNNRPDEMAKKLLFYEAHGVQEYYVYDPDLVTLAGYLRDRAGQLGELPVMDGHVSPLLGIRFELADELVVSRPDGQRFLTYLELVEQNEARQVEAARERRDAVKAYAELVEQIDARQAELARERQRADARQAEVERERQKAAAAEASAAREREQADREREKANAAEANFARERELADRERLKVAAAEAKVEALRARLRAAGIDPDAV